MLQPGTLPIAAHWARDTMHMPAPLPGKVGTLSLACQGPSMAPSRKATRHVSLPLFPKRHLRPQQHRGRRAAFSGPPSRDSGGSFTDQRTSVAFCCLGLVKPLSSLASETSFSAAQAHLQLKTRILVHVGSQARLDRGASGQQLLLKTLLQLLSYLYLLSVLWRQTTSCSLAARLSFSAPPSEPQR